MSAVSMIPTANKGVRRDLNHTLKKIILQVLIYSCRFPYSYDIKNKERKIKMADPTKFKSLSVNIGDWQELGVIANKTNRTRSKMIARLIRFYKENKGEKKNGKPNGKSS